jgi:hypothetical protein
LQALSQYEVGIMDNTQNLRKIKTLVRIVGVIFISLGLVRLILILANWATWSTVNTTQLACLLPIYLMMLIGGGFLLAFRQDGLDIIFVILRLYILVGIGGIISSVVARDTSTFISSCCVLAIVIGIMIFLSQSKVKSLFAKND